MKPVVALAACLGGCAVGFLLAAFLGVATDPAKMVGADHRMAYRLVPVLGVMLAVAVAAHAVRSRVVFWASLAAALGSLLVPEPNPGRVRYANLEGAAMASLHETFLHSATLALTFAVTAGVFARLAYSILVPALKDRRLPRSAGRIDSRNSIDFPEGNGPSLGSLKSRGRLAALVFVAYVGAYIPMSLSGGYRITQSGEIRYGFGFAVTDLVQWSPGLARCQLFKGVDGSWRLRANLLGYLFAPLILADQRIVHPTTRLFDPMTREPIGDWSAIEKID